MSNNNKCLVCGSDSNTTVESYHSGLPDKNGGAEIVVENVETSRCLNPECGNNWISPQQERKIERAVASRSRFDLTPSQITELRKLLGFNTKFQAADFLCLNEKAFTKWELGKSEPNRAYDLLLRLAALSDENISFIKKMHTTKFAFNIDDYKKLPDSNNVHWTSIKMGKAIVQLDSLKTISKLTWGKPEMIPYNAATSFITVVSSSNSKVQGEVA